MNILLIVFLFSQTNAFFSDFNNEINTVRKNLEDVFNTRDKTDCTRFFAFFGILNPIRERCKNNEEEYKSKVETREAKEYLSHQIDFGVDDTNKTLFYLLRNSEIQQKLSYMQNVLHIDTERLDEIKNFIFRSSDGTLESDATLKFIENLFKQPETEESDPENSDENHEHVEEIRHALEEIVEILRRNKTDNGGNENTNKNLIQPNITNISNDNKEVLSEWKKNDVNQKMQKEYSKSYEDIANRMFKESNRDNDENEKQDVKNENQDELNFKSDYPNSPTETEPQYFSSFDERVGPRKETAKSAEVSNDVQRLIEENQFAQMFMSSVQNNPDAQDVFSDANSFNFS